MLEPSFLGPVESLEQTMASGDPIDDTRVGSHRRRVASLLAGMLTIVVGVLVALGLEAIYNDAQEEAQERAYLAQLVADLGETASLMEEAESDPRNDLLLLEAWLNIAQTGRSAPDDSLRLLLGQVHDYNNPVPIFATAEVLVALGEFHVLDPASRAAIAWWLSETRDYELTPLYQVEEAYRNKVMDFLALAGLPEPSSDTGPPRGPLERLPVGQPLRHMLKDPRAYALAFDLYQLRESMGRYRARTARSASDLSDQLAPFR
jgi:hypothetical protein